MDKIRKVRFIGLGALGMLYGTRILRMKGEESLAFVMDRDRLEKYKDTVYTYNGEPVKYPMEAADEAVPADLVIMAVKYTALPSAIETMRKCVGEDTIIMSVMNGITTEEILAKEFGKEKVIYTVAQGMDAMKFGSDLTYTKYGTLFIGSPDEEVLPKVELVHQFFDEVGMPHVVEPNILRRMWSKFMLNVGINQTCMAFETTYAGALAPGEANRTFISAMREVVALANAEGIDLSEKDLNEYVAIIGTLTPDGVPSMAQDGISHRRTEVEMFAGAVIERAKKHHIYVPTNEFLLDKVHKLEDSWK